MFVTATGFDRFDGGGFDLPLPRHLGRSHEGAGLRCGAAGERGQAEE